MRDGPPNTATHPLTYRPDVDGLRAIAVLSVVVFHLVHSWLPGGFLGVDVFFVLSGFLITTIIWREALDGKFTLIRFYERRVRRIMPALLAVLALTTMVSLAVLLPTDLLGFGKSMLATLGFVANIYFWRDTDYFSHSAEQKPLLHIWSLGVEEQFYIFFPLLLMLLTGRGRRWAPYVVLGLSLLSLATEILLIRTRLANLAFFLLPSRAWELGAGAMLALLPQPLLSPARALVPSVIGLALLAAGLTLTVPWSWLPREMPVVLGAMLLIWSGRDNRGLVARLLGARLPVALGLISYSLYLWHWPIIVFPKYVLIRELTIAEIGIALALMFVCATLSWRFVERPFRSNRISRRRLLVLMAGGAAAVATVAAVILLGQGLPGRLPANVARLNEAIDRNYRCSLQTNLMVEGSRGCAIALPSGDPRDADVVLLGNSHAQMYSPVVASVLSERGQRGLLLFAYSCPPLTGFNYPGCAKQIEPSIAAAINLPRARTVILATHWSFGSNFVTDEGRSFTTSPAQAAIRGLDATIDRLRAAGKRVILVGPLYEPGWDVPSEASRRLAFGRPPRALRVERALFDKTFAPVIAHFEARRDITFIRPDLVQCPDAYCDFVREGRSLFADSGHLAEAALSNFRPIFSRGIAASADQENN